MNSPIITALPCQANHSKRMQLQKLRLATGCTRLSWLVLLLYGVLVLFPARVLAQSDSFLPPVSLPGTFSGRDVALGDIDNDGDLDIFVVNFRHIDIDQKALINQEFFPSTLWLNRGNGTFDLSSQSEKLGNAYAVLLGDFDNDGDLDAFLLSVEGNEFQGTIWINQDDAPGQFKESPAILPFNNIPPKNLVLLDIDGDTDLDIVSTTAIFINQGYKQQGEKGTFLLETAPSLPFYDCSRGRLPLDKELLAAPHHCASGDLDGDGKLDVAALDFEYQVQLIKSDEGIAPLSTSETGAIALGDLDGDGDLDAVVVSGPPVNDVKAKDKGDIQILFNPQIHFPERVQPAPPLAPREAAVCKTAKISIADLNQDRKLDLFVFNQALWGNGDGTFQVQPLQSTPIALGNLSGDNQLDIFDGQTIWQNMGGTRFTPTSKLTNSTDFSGQIADLDQDGNLDIFVRPNFFGQEQIFMNQGGYFEEHKMPSGELEVLSSIPIHKQVLLTDLNDDGYPDAILYHQYMKPPYDLRFVPIRVAFNDRSGNFIDSGQKLGGSNQATVVSGDFDDDQDTDIATREGVWFNDGKGNFSKVLYQDFNNGRPQVATDFDNDGDLDLYVLDQTISAQSLNATEFNPGVSPRLRLSPTQDTSEATFASIWLNAGNGLFIENKQTRITSSAVDAVVADLNEDGYLDIAQLACADSTGSSKLVPTLDVYLNQMGKLKQRTLLIQPLDPTGSTKGNSSSYIFTHPSIPITFTLSAPPGGESLYTRRACYSLNGGGNWQMALADGEKRRESDKLISPRSGCPYLVGANQIITATSQMTTQIFAWNTLASGFYGQSDNILFRIEIIPTYRPSVRSKAGSYQWPAAAANSLPFRARGTQVQVFQSTITATTPISNALVYHLPTSANHVAQPLADASGIPDRTNAQGYLQGHGQIAIGDRLIALLPITSTHSYTLYYTSATPTLNGLAAYTVTNAGVQTLTVTATHPLLLFNLTVALEWDARNDPAFQAQLRANLQRSSELLYTWTNGQAALGNITIYHNRQHWNEANIRILASNRLRPNSDQGGILSAPLTETATITKNGVFITTTLAYHPGQVRMPVVWTRFGATDNANLGEDWPRALAHELGHYLFFLYDNYLGADANGAFVAVNASDCPGAMTDPYRDDKFVISPGWPGKTKPGCENSASNRLAGRADWAIIGRHYPSMITPTVPYTGPNTLPLAVTQVNFVKPATADASKAVAVPIYSVAKHGNTLHIPSRQARAFLFTTDRLIDLGHPTGDQIKAWGASPGYRLCLFDPVQQQSGCKTLTSNDSELTLHPDKDWRPDILVSPISTSTLQINVTGVVAGLKLHARLQPADAISTTDEITLTQLDLANEYTGEFYNLPNHTREAYIHLWEGDQLTDASLQTVTDFAIGGSPNPDPVATTPNPCSTPLSGPRCSLAPVLSSDGQAVLLNTMVDLGLGQFYAIQTVSQVPSSPPWATVVGQAYRILTSASAPTLTNASLSLNYLSGEVPPGEKLTVYLYDKNTQPYPWRPLPTTLQPEVNSAVITITQPGLYLLMSSLEVPLAGRGWNLIGYPVQESRPVTVALQSINGQYQTVYGYDATNPNDPWKIYDRNLPPTFNDLTKLDFGQGYWVNITNTLDTTPILQLKGTSSFTTTRQAQRGVIALNLLYPPPATYYGELDASAGLTANMPITATIDGVICGIARTREIEGKLMYLIKVRAAIPGDTQHTSCGAPGRVVIFSGISQEPVKRLWDNNQVQLLKPEQ